jgi:hypothetical protein
LEGWRRFSCCRLDVSLLGDSLLFAVLLSQLDHREAEVPSDLDQDADPNEDKEGRKHLQSRIADYEVRVGDRRRRQCGNGEVEAVHEAPVLAPRVRERPDDDQR